MSNHPDPKPPVTHSAKHAASANALPTPDDLVKLAAEPKPPPEPHNAPYGLCEVLSPEVLSALSDDKVAGFFGSAFKPAEIALHVPKAQDQWHRVRRFENAVALQKQALAPHAIAIAEQVRVVMHRWDEFERNWPAEAKALGPLRDAWRAQHVGHPTHHAPASTDPKAK